MYKEGPSISGPVCNIWPIHSILQLIYCYKLLFKKATNHTSLMVDLKVQKFRIISTSMLFPRVQNLISIPDCFFHFLWWQKKGQQAFTSCTVIFEDLVFCGWKPVKDFHDLIFKVHWYPSFGMYVDNGKLIGQTKSHREIPKIDVPLKLQCIWYMFLCDHHSLAC